MSTAEMLIAALNTDTWMLPLVGALATSESSVALGFAAVPNTTSVYGCSPASGTLKLIAEVVLPLRNTPNDVVWLSNDW